MVKIAWDGVKEDTIKNCWYHCGFLDGHVLDGDLDDGESSFNLVLEDLNYKLKKLDSFAFDAFEYINIDNKVEVESMSVKEIVAFVLNEDVIEPIEAEDAIVQVVPTSAEANDLLTKLRAFFDNQDYDQESLKCLNILQQKIDTNIIGNLKQSKLDNFVKRKLF